MWPMMKLSSSTARCWCLLLVLLSNHALGGQQLNQEASGGGSRLPPPVIKGCTPELRHFRRYRYFHHLCRTQPTVAVAAYEGLREAVQECQHQMRFHKWDCTQDHPTAPRDFTVLHDPPILRYGYRESAFLSALSAAGAAWGVATACAQGWLDVCQCDTQQHATQQSWEWGGCSYGVKFGVVTSRKLLRSRPKTKQRTHMRQMEKHNLKAGRLAVKNTLVKSCKCHGVSGSCQQKTCWKKATDLSTIGEHLTGRFARARLLVVHNSPNDSNASLNKVRSSDLVYTEESPSFCEPNTQLRTVGTSGRTCNVRNATHTQGSCDRLCCGRGLTIRHEAVQYKCDCKFVWCCKVVCADCLKHHWVSTCK